MVILLSNDDGIQSEGLIALEESLRPIGEIYTVAPDRAQSSMSHALTLHRPLRVHEIAPRRMSVDGTPVDCVKLALTGLLPCGRISWFRESTKVPISAMILFIPEPFPPPSKEHCSASPPSPFRW